MRIFLVTCFILYNFACSYSQYYNINGLIVEETSGEPVIFATIHDSINKKSTITDEDGRFHLFSQNGNVSLKISSVGFKKQTLFFKLTNDTTLFVKLKTLHIKEVTIIAQEIPVHEQTISGKVFVPIKKINNLPSLAGQPDILKSLSFIPGVSNGKEGKSDLLVRGGEKDQNLILIDGATIYNPYHSGGFLTSINTEVVKSVEFYKGGFPARYGGRASSIVDIKLKEGNKNKWKEKIYLGLISSGIAIEGPIKKDKTSILAAFRSSYLQLLYAEANKQYREVEKIPLTLNNSVSNDIINLGFYDVNLKVTHILNPKGKISLNYYYGNDYQMDGSISSSHREAYQSEMGYNKNTSTTSLNFQYLLSRKISLKSELSFCKYNGSFFEYRDFISLEEKYLYDYKLFNITSDFGARNEFRFHLTNHQFRLGIQNNWIRYDPGKLEIKRINYISPNQSYDTIYKFSGENNLVHHAFYIEDEFLIRSSQKINIGLRIPNIITKYKNYNLLEPRISFRNKLGQNLSFKASYSVMHQFMHVLSSNYYGLEKETWVGSTYKIPPMKVQLLSSGFFGAFSENSFEWGCEFFYKLMKNVIYYHPGTITNEDYNNWGNLIISSGKGEAYGTELFLQKKTQNFYGYISYVLSWNNRQFNQLNNGKKYPFTYDKRHDGSVVIQYDLSETYSASLNFSINSGYYTTLPVAYISEGMFFPDYQVYSKINNIRLPMYHRLDLMTQKHWKSKNGIMQHFNVNIYNVYARKNPVYIYISNGKVYKKSFFTIIPTITYAIEF